MTDTKFTVFTKPWRSHSLEHLGELVARLGFWGVELPIRPGFQVEPEYVTAQLPNAVRILGKSGVTIHSVSPPMRATITPELVNACADSDVGIIRICVGVPKGTGYFQRIAEVQKEFHALLPVLEKSGVAIGVQNHNGHDLSHAMGLRELLNPFDPRQICAVWDPAHTALSGEIPEHAAEIIWPHLRMVNLKNAYWRRLNGPESPAAKYGVHWTSGRQGLAPWREIVEIVRARGYNAPVCLPAEYSDETDLERLISDDLEFAQSLFDVV